MIQYKTLFTGDFISVISPEKYPYECIHEGEECIVLVYFINEEQLLVREEFCPPYFIKDSNPRHYFTLLSGMVDDYEKLSDACFRELEEESGLCNINIEWFDVTKHIPIWKNSDIKATLFILGVTDYDVVKPEGDGSYYESQSKSVVMTLDEMKEIIDNNDNYDMLFLMSYYRLKELLSNGTMYKDGIIKD